MQCEAVIIPCATTLTTSLLSPTTSTRISFPTRPNNPQNLTRTRIRGQATINNGYTTSTSQKNISEMSFYELLGISETGTGIEIKQAYKHLARIYHPDVSPPDRVKENTERFIRVQEAYETLSDPNRRAVYDRHLSRGFSLAFSGRKQIYPYDQETEDKSDWRNRWQSQLSGLKNRSKYKDENDNMSWGARMRRQRNESESS